MSRGRLHWRLLAVAFVVVPLLLTTVNNLPAGINREATRTHVHIDGVDYGPFDQIKGLDDFLQDGSPSSKSMRYTKVTLTRDFVTDRSLYLWAKNNMSRKFQLQDIHLVTANDKGIVVSRHVLKLCQPLAWTVETTNPSLGGFNETIDLAVQKISVF